MNTKVFLIKFSPKLADGSRTIIEENVICTCKKVGDAFLIKKALEDTGVYNHLLRNHTDNEYTYLLTAEKRKPIK